MKKNFLKVLIVTLFVIVLAATLVACDDKKLPTQTPSAGGDGPSIGGDAPSTGGNKPPVLSPDEQTEQIFDLTLDENGYVINKYKGSASQLQVPSTYKGEPIYAIGEEAFLECESLTEVAIPDSVQSIGAYAFRDCTGLQTVTIGEGVQSIGDGAFEYCESLTEITIPDSVQSIGEYAFYDCTGLQTVTIGEGLQRLGEDVFNYCFKLVHIRNLSGVEISSRATDGEVLTSASAEFQNKIEKDANGIWTYTVGDKVYAFGYEGTSTTLTLGSEINAIYSYAFSGCTGLQTVTIGESVQSIGIESFEDCTGLQTVNWNATNCSNEFNNVFSGCTNLSSVNVGANVQNLPYDDDYDGSIFDDCYNLNVINVAEENAVYQSKDGIVYNKVDKSIHYVPRAIEGAITILDGCLSIGGEPFKGRYLTEITIPASVKKISPFYECGDLKAIIVAEENAVYLSNEGIVYKKEDTSIHYVPKGIEGAVTILDGCPSIGLLAFSGCTGITSVIIPDSVEIIGEYAFSSCKGLQTITIPDSVQSIGEMAFAICESLTEITIPDSVTDIGGRAFYRCIGLQTVKIGTGVQSIGGGAFGGAFYYCDNLKAINVAEGNVVYQSKDGILYNKEDKSIYIVPRNIEGAVTILDGCLSIGDSAFEYRRGLTEITIPDSVQSIGDRAFCDCTGLKDMYYEGNTIQWNNIVKGAYWDNYRDSYGNYSSRIEYQMHYNSTGPASASAASEEAEVILQNSVVDVYAQKVWVKQD